MDRIEQQGRLPKDALPIDRYARYYGQRSDGNIEAVYLDPAAIPSALPAGERRWLEDVDDLPAINDGQCHVVSVEFDPRTGEAKAFCNGEA